jgi:hypothetical protein
MAGGLGRGAAQTLRSAGARVRRAGTRDITARWRPGPNCFAGHQFEINFLQNLVYKRIKH